MSRYSRPLSVLVIVVSLSGASRSTPPLRPYHSPDSPGNDPPGAPGTRARRVSGRARAAPHECTILRRGLEKRGSRLKLLEDTSLRRGADSPAEHTNRSTKRSSPTMEGGIAL